MHRGALDAPSTDERSPFAQQIDDPDARLRTDNAAVNSRDAVVGKLDPAAIAFANQCNGAVQDGAIRSKT
jgi:hypothetical protein